MLTTRQTIETLAGEFAQVVQSDVASGLRIARRAKRLAEEAHARDDVEALGLVSDFLLPYLAQRLPVREFSPFAGRMGDFFEEIDDWETAATWHQFRAISLRQSRQFRQAHQAALRALDLVTHPDLPIREAYCRLTLAGIDLKLLQYDAAARQIQWVQQSVPLTDATTWLHAQADLELAKLHLRIQDGKKAAWSLESAMTLVGNESRAPFADAILYGYRSEALYFMGRHGQAYTSGLASTVALVHQADYQTACETCLAFHSLLERGIYGFREEKIGALHLERILLFAETLSTGDEVELRRSLSLLYLFHCEHSASPRERYQNPLAEICAEYIECS